MSEHCKLRKCWGGSRSQVKKIVGKISVETESEQPSVAPLKCGTSNFSRQRDILMIYDKQILCESSLDTIAREVPKA